MSDFKLGLITFIFIMLITILCSGCVTTPNGYNQHVLITKGAYSGQKGKLIGACSGFERYKIRLNNKSQNICVYIWNLEKI